MVLNDWNLAVGGPTGVRAQAKFLGEVGAKSPIQAAVVVGCPWDLLVRCLPTVVSLQACAASATAVAGGEQVTSRFSGRPAVLGLVPRLLCQA